MAPNDPASRYSCFCVIPSSWVRPDLVTRFQQLEYNESYEILTMKLIPKRLLLSHPVFLSVFISLSEPLLEEERWGGRRVKPIPCCMEPCGGAMWQQTNVLADNQCGPEAANSHTNELKNGSFETFQQSCEWLGRGSSLRKALQWLQWLPWLHPWEKNRVRNT